MVEPVLADLGRRTMVWGTPEFLGRADMRRLGRNLLGNPSCMKILGTRIWPRGKWRVRVLGRNRLGRCGWKRSTNEGARLGEQMGVVLSGAIRYGGGRRGGRN